MAKDDDDKDTKLQAELDKLKKQLEEQTTQSAADIKALKKTNADLVEEKRTLEKLEKDFKGVDKSLLDQVKNMNPEDLAAFNRQLELAEDEEMLDALRSGQLKTLVETKAAAVVKKKDEEIAALTKENQELKDEVVRLKQEGVSKERTIARRNAISKVNLFSDESKAMVEVYLANAQRTDEEGEVYFVDDNGEMVKSTEHVGKPAGTVEFLREHVAKKHRYFLKTTKIPSGNPSDENLGDDSKNPFITGNRIAQMELRAKNLDEAKRLANAARNSGKGKIKISGV